MKKKTPLDEWSIREKLCLASAVLRSGDQNWASVSRAVKPLGEPDRHNEWFSQKNCASQYSELLEQVSTPRRKREKNEVVETQGETVVRNLTIERLEELRDAIRKQHDEYRKNKNIMEQIKAGEFDDKLDEMLEEISGSKMDTDDPGEGTSTEEQGQAEVKDEVIKEETTSDTISEESAAIATDATETTSDVAPSTSAATEGTPQPSSQSAEPAATVETRKPSSLSTPTLTKLLITPPPRTSVLSVTSSETPPPAPAGSGTPAASPAAAGAIGLQTPNDVTMTEVEDPAKLNTPQDADPCPPPPVVEVKRENAPEVVSDDVILPPAPPAPPKDSTQSAATEPAVERDDDAPPLSPDSSSIVSTEPESLLPPSRPASRARSNRPPARSSRGSRRSSRTNSKKLEEADLSSKPSEAETSDDDNDSASKVSDSIPNSPAGSAHFGDSDEEKQHKMWKKSIMIIWKFAANHKNASTFSHPVTDDIAPAYSQIVKRPMCLSQIKRNIESGAIRTTPEFQRDMMLVFINAMMYNDDDHDVHQKASDLFDEIMVQMQQYISAQVVTAPPDATKHLRGARRSDVSSVSDKEEEIRKRRTSEPDSGAGGKSKKRK